MLKQDGTLCCFSLCMEQVQRSCETLRSDFIEIYGPLKYCSACMKSVNGKWIMMGIPLHAHHARGGRLQVKQVWGTMQFLRQSWLGHLLKLEDILDV
ncbi:hypothetical protein ES288_A06G000400v1 [Gossypium darwinii]|uniref:tRNA (adenine(58)-N(1))-methyltransferase catalytic subunit TRM61 C-terminal domain-containing protein n=1 Tax=Gossypium darwinii TaxID=34276 RepID=A0A5D2G0A7_GOSDA|nr:hypothetical protein ES288_A06G000400v1 [Gossypium darwinii]